MLLCPKFTPQCNCESEQHTNWFYFRIRMKIPLLYTISGIFVNVPAKVIE